MRSTLASVAFLFVMATTGSAAMASAQDAQAQVAQVQKLYEVKTTDGGTYFGYLKSETPERIIVRTPGGAIIELARADILSMTETEGTMVGQEFRPADSNPTRLFFGPTARSLKKGEGYVGTFFYIMPTVQVGITDRLSIGGGTPLVVGGGSLPIWITPKFQVYDSPRAAVAVGALHFLNIDDHNVGIAYAAGTFGSRDDAVTVGVGWAYANNDRNDEGAAVVMIGGERRASRRIKWITENYIWNGGGFVSGGVRFLGDSLSADLGLVSPLGIDELYVFPVMNFVWKF
jgi:hypothetical protein